MKVSFIVDLKSNFCSNGAFPFPDGDYIVPVINRLLDKSDYVLASMEWHRANAIHFGT